MLLTSIDSIRELSEDFLISMSPDSISTFSEKVSSILLFIANWVALLFGLEVLNFGGAISSDVKERDVLSLIPAKELPVLSSKAEASIWT